MYYYGGYISETSDGDLTVTVTLKKYRELCRESASHDRKRDTKERTVVTVSWEEQKR